MSPDSPETRIARLEQKVAKLEQRVEDLLVQIKTQFDGLDADIRAFAPMVKEVHDLQHQLGLALNEARAARTELSDLRTSLEAREKERRRASAEREKERRQERKVERRFFVTSLLATAGLIIAALQVLGV